MTQDGSIVTNTNFMLVRTREVEKEYIEVWIKGNLVERVKASII